MTRMFARSVLAQVASAEEEAQPGLLHEEIKNVDCALLARVVPSFWEVAQAHLQVHLFQPAMVVAGSNSDTFCIKANALEEDLHQHTIMGVRYYVYFAHIRHRHER